MMHLNPQSTAENVWDVLSNAAIEWTLDERGSTYVTSFAFPFWLDVLPDDEGFSFYTYCPVREGVAELEFLRFVNDCNQRLPMVQFSASKCGGRFQAHYSLYKPEGLHQRSFLFAMRRFNEIFMSVLKDEDNHVTALNCDVEELPLRQDIAAILH